MENKDIAKVFYDLADILDMQNVQWKPIAFRKAARTIENMSKSIKDIYKKGGIKALMEIEGIGEGIAKKIEELLTKGSVKALEEQRKKLPKGLPELMSIQGLGPKKAWKLYKKLNIKSISDLEKAAKSGKIRNLESFGEKSEQD